jgi:hypothetical protein
MYWICIARKLAIITLMATIVAQAIHALGAVTSRPIVHPQNETADAERVRIARENGFWTVASGDHLYAIARRFAASEKEVVSLVAELRRSNPSALLKPSGDQLRIDAQLTLPERLWATNVELAAKARESAIHQSPTNNSLDTGAVARVKPQAGSEEPVKRYVDKLIDESRATQPDLLDEQLAPPVAGLRSTSIEYRAEFRDDIRAGQPQPRGVEQGVLFRYQRETLNYGLIGVETIVRNVVRERQHQHLSDGAHFVLTQLRLPVGGAWLADNTLGVVHIGASPLISSSYRVSLPSPTILGAGSVVRTEQREVRAVWGRPGELTGNALPVLVTRAGRIAQLGYTEKRGGGDELGAHLITVQGSELAKDSLSASAALGTGLPGQVRTKSQIAADQHGHWGGWHDSEIPVGRDKHRLGMYWVTRGFQWADAGVINDVAGAYWRGDFRVRDRSHYAGAEWTRTNLDNDAVQTGTESVYAYAGTNLRLSRELNVGATLSLQQSQSRPRGREEREYMSASTYASLRTMLGLSRLDGTASRANRTTMQSGTEMGIDDDGRETISALTLSQDWPLDRWLGSAFGLTTTFTQSNERIRGKASLRKAATLHARGPLMTNAYWDVSITHAANQTRANGVVETERNTNANVSLNWRMARDWVLSSSYTQNTIDTSSNTLFTSPLGAPVQPLSPFVRDRRWLLSIRYDHSSGTPLMMLGRPTGQVGSGDISGVVFFDDNGDGVRQAVERGVVGMLILLDGRIPVTTDRDGRFSFNAVRSGAHTLTFSAEKLPLPWGLVDEDMARQIQVPLRAELKLSIPVIKNAG